MPERLLVALSDHAHRFERRAQGPSNQKATTSKAEPEPTRPSLPHPCLKPSPHLGKLAGFLLCFLGPAVGRWRAVVVQPLLICAEAMDFGERTGEPPHVWLRRISKDSVRARSECERCTRARMSVRRDMRCVRAVQGSSLDDRQAVCVGTEATSLNSTHHTTDFARVSQPANSSTAALVGVRTARGKGAESGEWCAPRARCASSTQ